MKIIYLSIAGFNIGVKIFPSDDHKLEESFIYNNLSLYFKGFILENMPNNINFWINIRSLANYRILIRNKKSVYLNFFKEKAFSIETYSHVSPFQLQIVIRSAVQKLLAKNNGFILHGSAVVIHGSAQVFVGKSGAGKSTVAQLLKDEYRVIADDSIIVKKEKKGYFVYQTPLFEKNSNFSKTFQKYHLNKIFFLTKSQNYKITEISNKQLIIKRIIKQLFTEDTDKDQQVQTILNFVADCDDFYKLEFGKEKTKLISILSQ